MTLPQQDEPSDGAQHSIYQMLASAGEIGALIREKDWSKTPLGSIDTWSQSLQTALSICLFSRYPMFVWWGTDYIQIYNDAYIPILAHKHPQALGLPGREIWGEIWHIIGSMVDSVYYEGKSTWSSDQMLPMYRYGFTEETYFTFSYSPIFDETGSVGGVFTACTETTKQVLNQRRLKTLHDLGEQASDGKTVEVACRSAAAVLTNNQADVPFALIYLFDESGESAHLAGSSTVDAVSDMFLSVIDMTREHENGWLLRELQTTEPIVTNDLANRFQDIPPGIWDEAPTTAMILPIMASGLHQQVGFIILGVSPRLALDEDYRQFFELVAGHIATAITTARAHEEERKRAEALAELDRAKTEFFSNISHEFRTPLTLMLNPLRELLDNGSNLDTVQYKNLDVAHRNSLRLLKLVNTLLDFSRIQSNRIRASFQPTDLAALTTDLASNFRSAVEGAGLRFVIDAPPLSEPAYIDRDMWEKIVLNLLSNAFKFTFEGEIVISLRQTEKHFELSVRDTGIGIAEADLPHIFERFHRVRGARSRTYEGSGIGLALVAQLVQFHGGEIEVSSEVGKGTTFTISIPTGADHLPQDQLETANDVASTAIDAAIYTEEALHWLDDETREIDEAEAQNLVSKYDTSALPIPAYPIDETVTILVADDNFDMRDYLRRLLGQRYRVETVSDGVEALKLIEQQPPSLVIADVMMPNMDGFALLNRLRSDSQTRAIPIILLSARAGEETRIQGLQAGADDYLIKPFSARELLARVEAQLQLSQLRRDTQAQLDSEHQRLIDMFESITDGFVAVDREFRYTYINQQAGAVNLALTGHPPEYFLGRTIWEAIPTMYDSPFGEVFRRAMAEGKPGQLEGYFEPVNRWFSLRVYPSKEGLSVYFADITEQQQTRTALLEAENRLTLAQEAGNIGIWDWNGITNETYWTETMWRLYGLEPRLTVKTDDIWETMLHPDDLPRVRAKIDRLLTSTETNYRDEFRINHTDGTVRWLESIARIERNEQMQPVRMTGVNFDITRRKYAEDALRNAEERLRLMIDSAKDYAIFAVDEDGYIMNWNTGAERLFGYPEVEIIGEHFRILYTREDRDARIHEKELEKAAEVGYAEDERWHVREDGSRFYASGMVRPIRNEAGVLQGFTKIARDMTAKKLAEQRTKVLQDLAISLAAQSTLNEMAETVIRAVHDAVSEAVVSVFLLSDDGQTLERVLFDPLAEPYQPLVHTMSLDMLLPIPEAVRTKSTIWIGSMAEIQARYPHIAQALSDNQIHAGFFTPLWSNQHEVMGGFGLLFRHPKQLSTEEHDLLIAITHLCSQAFQRAQLFEAEQAASRSAALRADRLSRIQMVTAALLPSLDFAEIARLIIDVGVTTLGASTGAFNYFEDEDTVHVVYSFGSSLSPAERQNWIRFPLNPEIPLNDILQHGEPIWLESGEEVLQRYPKLQRFVDVYPGAWIMLPITVEGRVIGAVGFAFMENREFPQEERDFVLTLAQQCSQALERSLLYEAEKQAKYSAALRADRLSKLQMVTATLLPLLEFEEIARVVTDVAVTALDADTGVFSWLEDENTLWMVYSVGSKMPDDERENWRRFPVDSGLPSGDVIRRGEPIWLESNEAAQQLYPNMKRVSEFYPGAWMMLPLFIKGKVVGGLGFAFTESRSFNQEERDFMMALAQQCSQALERNQLYEEEKQARQNAEEANALKNQYLDKIGEELRNTIASINTFASTLLSSDVNTEKEQQVLHIINDETDRLTQLVEQLRNLSPKPDGESSHDRD